MYPGGSTTCTRGPRHSPPNSNKDQIDHDPLAPSQPSHRLRDAADVSLASFFVPNFLISAAVSALNKVDLPTFGSPTIPHRIAIRPGSLNKRDPKWQTF